MEARSFPRKNLRLQKNLNISDGWICPVWFYFWSRFRCGGIDLLRWCRRLWFLRVLSLVTFGGHGFWLGHDGLCNFCVQRRTRTFSDGWFVKLFLSPICYLSICVEVCGFAESFTLAPSALLGGFLWLGHDGIWKRIRLQGNFEYAEKLGTFQMRTAPPLLLLESLRELKRIWSTKRVGGLSSPLLVVVSKFVGSPCVFESFTTHCLFVLSHVWCP